jgi:hypothetical protein
MSNNPEELQSSQEHGIESQVAGEQLEKLRNSAERSAELSPEDAEKQEQVARHEALKNAVGVESGGAEKKRDGAPHKVPKRGGISKAQKNASFKKQMKEVQSQLSPSSRAFSKVIHAKPIEKTSEVVGSTIARPNAVLSGAVAAFILTLAVYVIAKNTGYSLSGFETIGSFIVGWIIGITFDYLRVLITGKTS